MSIGDRVKQRLKMVIDPETGLDLVEMDLVQNLSATEDGEVKLRFRPSSFVCPLALELAQEIRHSLREIEGVKSVHVEVTDCLWADDINKAITEEESPDQ
jgi:metal-sulfur cluster biosynthetic enzyme